jgi:hypothetical protein
MTKPEYQFQVDVTNWLHLAYPQLLWTISPSGMILSAGMAMKVKNMGYRAGTPDIIILCPRGGFHGLLIELKIKAIVTNPQIGFLAEAREQGYEATVCRSMEEVQRVVKHYLNQPKGVRHAKTQLFQDEA